MFAADLSFTCSCCRGPLVVEVVHAGRETECPHCYSGITIPEGSEASKDAANEPTGLRRVLLEVRDREWEVLRRKLRVAYARVIELEEVSREALSSTATSAEAASELDVLRTQVATADETVAELHHELREARGLAESLEAEREALSAALESERAKVFLMEAAGGSALTQLAGEVSPPDSILIAELQLQITELRKENESLRRSRLAREILAPVALGASAGRLQEAALE